MHVFQDFFDDLGIFDGCDDPGFASTLCTNTHVDIEGYLFKTSIKKMQIFACFEKLAVSVENYFRPTDKQTKVATKFIIS